MTRLTPLARSSLADEVADLLREKILNGEFTPGIRLVEAEIARQLGISRGPVREALATLKAEGLTRETRGRGSYVRVLSPEDVNEIYDMRATLETGAIRLVLERGDIGALEQLERALGGMKVAALANDRSLFVESDLYFHEELCRVSENTRLLEAWQSQVALLRALFRLEIHELIDDPMSLYEDHARIVTSMREQRFEAASRSCWSLFRQTSELVGKALGEGQARTTGGVDSAVDS